LEMRTGEELGEAPRAERRLSLYSPMPARAHQQSSGSSSQTCISPGGAVEVRLSGGAGRPSSVAPSMALALSRWNSPRFSCSPPAVQVASHPAAPALGQGAGGGGRGEGRVRQRLRGSLEDGSARAQHLTGVEGQLRALTGGGRAACRNLHLATEWRARRADLWRQQQLAERALPPISMDGR